MAWTQQSHGKGIGKRVSKCPVKVKIVFGQDTQCGVVVMLLAELEGKSELEECSNHREKAVLNALEVQKIQDHARQHHVPLTVSGETMELGAVVLSHVEEEPGPEGEV